MIGDDTGRLTRRRLAQVAAASGLALRAPLAFAQTGSAVEIMRRAFDAPRPRSSTYQASLTLKSASGVVSLRELDCASLRTDPTSYARLVRFLSPRDIKGISTLTIQREGRDDDVWVYLPALKKVRHLVTSNRRDAYFGTEFSFGDILGPAVNDWTHALGSDVTIDGTPCWQVVSTAASPKVIKDFGYSRMASTVRKDSFIQARVDYFGAAGAPLKSAFATDIRQVDAVDDRWMPMRIEMINASKNRSSLIEIRNYKAGVSLSPDQFTASSLAP